MLNRRSTPIFCPSCEQWKPCDNGRMNQAKKLGKKLYCSRECAGIGRRKENPKSPNNPNWKQMKADYDREYRTKNTERLKAEKAARYKVTGPMNRGKERAYREKRMPAHVEYCRRPEYKAWKHKYDLKFRAKKLFGPFAEASLVLRDVEMEISKRMTWVEIRQANGTLNKSTQRKRDYARIANQTSTR